MNTNYFVPKWKDFDFSASGIEPHIDNFLEDLHDALTENLGNNFEVSMFTRSDKYCTGFMNNKDTHRILYLSLDLGNQKPDYNWLLEFMVNDSAHPHFDERDSFSRISFGDIPHVATKITHSCYPYLRSLLNEPIFKDGKFIVNKEGIASIPYADFSNMVDIYEVNKAKPSNRDKIYSFGKLCNEIEGSFKSTKFYGDLVWNPIIGDKIDFWILSSPHSFLRKNIDPKNVKEWNLRPAIFFSLKEGSNPPIKIKSGLFSIRNHNFIIFKAQYQNIAETKNPDDSKTINIENVGQAIVDSINTCKSGVERLDQAINTKISEEQKSKIVRDRSIENKLSTDVSELWEKEVLSSRTWGEFVIFTSDLAGKLDDRGMQSRIEAISGEILLTDFQYIKKKTYIYTRPRFIESLDQPTQLGIKYGMDVKKRYENIKKDCDEVTNQLINFYSSEDWKFSVSYHIGYIKEQDTFEVYLNLINKGGKVAFTEYINLDGFRGIIKERPIKYQILSEINNMPLGYLLIGVVFSSTVTLTTDGSIQN